MLVPDYKLFLFSREQTCRLLIWSCCEANWLSRNWVKGEAVIYLTVSRLPVPVVVNCLTCRVLL